jgi:hypothetical protein
LDNPADQHGRADVASDAVKREYVAVYEHGMGINLYLVSARSADEIVGRYPLFQLFTPDQAIDQLRGITKEYLEGLRMYPGSGRPRDAAVATRSQDERERFIEAQERHWAEALQRYRGMGILGRTMSDVADSQYWVDIDDDADFRLKMHEYWRDDPRYKELPPEKRLA